MNGDELRAARVAAHLTQQELADLLKVSLRTVGNWERSTGRLPRSRERQVRDILGAVDGTDDPLDAVSDMALVAQLTKRLERAARERSETHGREQEKSPGGPEAAATGVGAAGGAGVLLPARDVDDEAVPMREVVKGRRQPRR